MLVKNLIDYFVIISATTIIFLISYYGDQDILGAFAIIVFLVGYYAGKTVRNYEMTRGRQGRL